MKTFTHYTVGALAVIIESGGVRLALTEQELRELIDEARNALEKLEKNGEQTVPNKDR